MIETLRKRSRSSNMIRALLAIIVVVGLLVFTKFAILDVLFTQHVDITGDLDAYTGKYVTADVDFVLSDYIEHTTTTTRESGSSSTSVNGYSYLVFQSIPDYENNTSVWYFYSVYMTRAKQDEMYDLMDEAWDYLLDESGTTAPPDALQLSGTWGTMDSQTERYYRETLAEIGIEETEFDKFCFYTLDTSKIGGQTVALFWIMMAVSLILFLAFVVNVMGCFSKAYVKNINQYLQKNTSVSMADIEADFAQAHLVGKDYWVGKKWTIYVVGPKAYILTNRELVWGYYFKRTGKNSVSQIRLFDAEKKHFYINMSESQAHQALGYYNEEQPQMMVGYSQDIEAMFNKNFEEFKNLKYNPAMSPDSAGTFFSM